MARLSPVAVPREIGVVHVRGSAVGDQRALIAPSSRHRSAWVGKHQAVVVMNVRNSSGLPIQCGARRRGRRRDERIHVFRLVARHPSICDDRSYRSRRLPADPHRHPNQDAPWASRWTYWDTGLGLSLGGRNTVPLARRGQLRQRSRHTHLVVVSGGHRSLRMGTLTLATSGVRLPALRG